MSRHAAAAARDAALARLRRLNRALVAGSAVLIAVFSEAAAAAIPGQTVTRAGAATTKQVPHRRHHQPAATGTDPAPRAAPAPVVTPPVDSAPQAQSAELAPPPAAPVVTRAPAQTSSGGS